MTVLKRRHSDEITKDVSQAIKMAIGTACHAGIEDASSWGTNGLGVNSDYGEIERRHSAKFGDITVSGQVDWYSRDDKLLTDWKFTSVWAVMNQTKEEWNRQLNIYAHLLRLNDRPVETAQIGATCVDWRKGEKLQVGENYPPIMFMAKPVLVWWSSTTAAFINTVIDALVAQTGVRDDDLPLCTPSERWIRSEEWGAKKKANKRATKSFKAKDGYNGSDAWDYVNAQPNPGAWDVIHKDGGYARCEDFCDACQFCDFYKESVECG